MQPRKTDRMIPSLSTSVFFPPIISKKGFLTLLENKVAEQMTNYYKFREGGRMVK